MFQTAEDFNYSLGNIRQGWVATTNHTSYNSVYLYLDAEAPAITSVYPVGVMEHH